ncbi:MAG: chemotaxis protein CheA [Myxococcales bacterium]|nr:chemotaxis protein CheA [Myxococcales bacterium]
MSLESETPFERFRRIFLEECQEHLLALESGLLALESQPGDDESINAVFRAAHSIKGGALAMGLEEIGTFTHVLESVLDLMREHQLDATASVIDVLLPAKDVVASLVAAASAGVEARKDETYTTTFERLRGLLDTTAPTPSAPVAVPVLVSAPHETRYRVVFSPGPELYRQGLDPLLVLDELQSLCTSYEVRCTFDEPPELGLVDPECNYATWQLDIASERPLSELEDPFAFCGGATFAAAEPPAGDAAPQGLETRGGSTPSSRPTTALRTSPERGSEASTIRVPTAKIDRLIDAVGELITAKSMLKDIVANFNPEDLPRLEAAVRDLERNTRELQEGVMGVRMVPVSSLFQRFPRMVRDLASSLGKQVSLRTYGGDTELDKTVIDLIVDPLTHLVRNALDHGVEPPAERVAAGKNPQAELALGASHVAGSVEIIVEDDGRGLQSSRILSKAIERGLVSPGQQLAEEDVHALIFAPGFSTADGITDVSGRGVGMDVVKRNVETLNGSIRLESLPGRGTRFVVTLPLTLAILDGLCVTAGDELYVLPLLSVLQSFRAESHLAWRVMARDEVVLFQGQTLPLVRLGALFDADPPRDEQHVGLVVVVEQGGRRFALLVDEVRGQIQVVMKNLETHYQPVPGVMGATILGNGRVALVIDVAGLATLCGMSGRREPARARLGNHFGG